jgi:hypothetical protein
MHKSVMHIEDDSVTVVPPPFEAEKTPLPHSDTGR